LALVLDADVAASVMSQKIERNSKPIFGSCALWRLLAIILGLELGGTGPHRYVSGTGATI
jgi:hypothetical protein